MHVWQELDVHSFMMDAEGVMLAPEGHYRQGISIRSSAIARANEVRPEFDCYVLFTSGSTGRPRGTAMSCIWVTVGVARAVWFAGVRGTHASGLNRITWMHSFVPFREVSELSPVRYTKLDRQLFRHIS